ncbi:hypothetical protein cypCar_00003840, partial [Cyprinus carpio]
SLVGNGQADYKHSSKKRVAFKHGDVILGMDGRRYQLLSGPPGPVGPPGKRGCAGKRGYIGYKGVKESEEQMGQGAYQDLQVHQDSQSSTFGGTQRRIGLHLG